MGRGQPNTLWILKGGETENQSCSGSIGVSFILGTHVLGLEGSLKGGERGRVKMGSNHPLVQTHFELLWRGPASHAVPAVSLNLVTRACFCLGVHEHNA